MKKQLYLFALLILSTSCVSLFQMKRLGKCEFEYKEMVNVDLAGVKMDNIKNIAGIGFVDAAKLAKGYMSGNLPMTAVALIDVQNPNNKKAAINRLEWRLNIDGNQVTQGVITDRFVVEGHSTATMPIELSMNLGESLKGENKTSLLNFVMNLTNAGVAPSRLEIFVKPSMKIGEKQIPYPGFIKVRMNVGDDD